MTAWRWSRRPEGLECPTPGTAPPVSLLLIPLVLTCAFALPFVMARLEPKQTPAHRATTRRTTPR